MHTPRWTFDSELVGDVKWVLAGSRLTASTALLIVVAPEGESGRLRTKPFLKWAGGKRWLIERTDFVIPKFSGKYIEPFLGGGAIFFSLKPERALISDSNKLLIETYGALKEDWKTVFLLLEEHHKKHSKDYYYIQRATRPVDISAKAARFIYLNRSCWNGLYRVNRNGEFNVPIGTKDWILSPNDDFESLSETLQHAEINHCDFEQTLAQAENGDFVFLDPPYTTAHNMNGFVKYNETIFAWDDQIRLAAHAKAAADRGATVVITNADHQSVRQLYADCQMVSISRTSVISGPTKGRRATTELIIWLEPK